jgi:3-O-alpha-D-mannopyranosyl-alpha-D-mannopyranose xylosylphosphotransferase
MHQPTTLRINIPPASPTSPTVRAMSTSAYSPSSPLSGTEPALSRRRSQDANNRGYLSSTYLARITEEEGIAMKEGPRTPTLHGGLPPSPSATRGLFDQEYSPITTTFPSRVHRTRTVSGNREHPSRTTTTTPSRRIFFPMLRRWILNPLLITTGRYHLRSLSTLFIWLLTLWILVNYLMPTSPIISNSQSQLKNTFDWIPSPWRSKHKAPVIPSPYFPEPSPRPGDAYNSPNKLYRAFRPLEGPDVPFPRLRPTRFLPPKCLESWFADGEILCGRHQLGPEEMLDITWLWVNGSDARWQKDMTRVRQEKGIYSPEHHFRENNELLYSMRSVLQNLPGRLRTFHLITADSAFDAEKDLGLLPHQAIQELEKAAQEEFQLTPMEERRLGDEGVDLSGKGTVKSAFSLGARAGARLPDNVADHPTQSDPVVSDRLKLWLNSTWRVAQAPGWLSYDMIDLSSPRHPLHSLYTNPTKAKPAEAAHLYFNSHPSLKYAGHSEIFHLPSRPQAGSASENLQNHKRKEEEWRRQALPNFNSMAIESRIGFLWGLGDVSLSFNDDFFILKPHAVSDFYSPLYGTVIRFDQGVSHGVIPLLLS